MDEVCGFDECLEVLGDFIVKVVTCARSDICVKLLKVLAISPKPLYTRQLLQLAGTSWGKAGRVGRDPEAALKILEKLGFIKRWEEECWIDSKKKPGLRIKTKCKYNQITPLGVKAYKIIMRIK